MLYVKFTELAANIDNRRQICTYIVLSCSNYCRFIELKVQISIECISISQIFSKQILLTFDSEGNFTPNNTNNTMHANVNK